MLNGIGGNSIREAKETLALTEAREWVDYIRERGSLNIGARMDRGFALLAHFICVGHQIKINGKIPGMDDLLPKRVQPQEICTDINQAFAFLKSVKKDGK